MPLDKDLKAIAAARAKAAATARYTGQATRGTPTSVTRKPTPTRTVTHGRPGRTAAAPKKPTYDSGTAAVKPKKSKNKHQVKEGQNIETLALDFGVPSAEILRANPGVQRLRPGQVLNIPEPIVTAAQNTQRRQWVEDQARLVEQQKPGQRPSGRIHETIDLTQAENQVKPFWQQTPWETFQQITNAIFQPKNKLQSRVHEEAQGSRRGIQGTYAVSPDTLAMQQERAQGYTVPASGPGLTGYTPQPWTQEDYDRQIRVQGWRWTGNALTAWARGEGDIDARPDYLDPEFVAQVPGLAEKLLNGQFGYILGPDGIWRKKSLAPLPGGGYYGNYQSTPYYGGGGSARRRSGGRGGGGGGGGGGKSNDGVVYGVGSRLSDEGGMFARPDSGRAPFEVQAAAHWRI